MTTSLPASCGDLLDEVHRQSPLVQCITNYVAMSLAANVLLAAGASPAMVHAPEEAGEFATLSGAVTINIGTLSTPWLEGMCLAAKAANDNGTPWVLDPVAHFATAFRRKAVDTLLALKPTVIRGNASEIMALAGDASSGRGVDSGDSVERAEVSAMVLARRTHAVVAVTGAMDFVTDGRDSVRIAGGSELMPKITAMGCALTGLVGACIAVAPASPLEATVCALTCFSVAGTQAAQSAKGPGSFAWQFIDALAALRGIELKAHAQMSRA